MEADLKKLKDDYAAMIYFAYKNRKTYNNLMFILSSRDFNQAYRRLKYLQQYTEFRKKQVLAIQSTQLMLDTQIARLEKEKQAKELLEEGVKRLAEYQEKLYAQGTYSVLIILKICQKYQNFFLQNYHKDSTKKALS